MKGATAKVASEEAEVLVDTCAEVCIVARELVKLFAAASWSRRKGVSKAVANEAHAQLGEMIDYLNDVANRQASMRFPGGADAQAKRVVKMLKEGSCE